MDIFYDEDVLKLLHNKTVVFMGDSNMRAQYKDLLCLVHQNKFISLSVLHDKMEFSCFGDRRTFCGPKSNGRNYKEERQYENGGMEISFYFLTRVYNEYMANILERISSREKKPDVLIINSCVWDVTRWGCNGVEMYKQNLTTLMKECKRLLPDALVIWQTTPPIANQIKGGFLVPELQFLKYSLRFHVVEANHFARKVVVENGFDVLDIHYHMKSQVHRRANDGIHWFAPTIRYNTNLFLSHVSLAWNVPLPHRYEPQTLKENVCQIVKSNPASSEVQSSTTSQENKTFSTCAAFSSRASSKDEENLIKPKRTLKERDTNVKESHNGRLYRQHREERRHQYRRFVNPYMASNYVSRPSQYYPFL